jgi:hypothetical protein
MVPTMEITFGAPYREHGFEPEDRSKTNPSFDFAVILEALSLWAVDVAPPSSR